MFCTFELKISTLEKLFALVFDKILFAVYFFKSETLIAEVRLTTIFLSLLTSVTVPSTVIFDSSITFIESFM